MPASDEEIMNEHNTLIRYLGVTYLKKGSPVYLESTKKPIYNITSIKYVSE